MLAIMVSRFSVPLKIRNSTVLWLHRFIALYRLLASFLDLLIAALSSSSGCMPALGLSAQRRMLARLLRANLTILVSYHRSNNCIILAIVRSCSIWVSTNSDLLVWVCNPQVSVSCDLYPYDDAYSKVTAQGKCLT